MSLIYQALEKAQQDKQKEAAAAGAALQEAAADEARPGSNRALAPLVISAAGIAACAVYFLFAGASGKPHSPASPQTAATQPPSAVPQGPAVPAAADALLSPIALPKTMTFPDVVPPAADEPVRQPESVPQPVPAGSTVEAVPDSVPVAPPQQPRDDAELPGDIALSGIISDESSSLAIINGKILSEGEIVRENVRIKKINKDSVVVEMNGKEFTLEK